jgi:DNA polymerase-3 subunit beta
MKAEKKTNGHKAKAPLTPLQQKVEKIRSSWTEAMHAAVVKNFPGAADLESMPLVPVPHKKIEELQRMLADDEKRLASDVTVYEGLRRDGIKKLSDYALTQATPAKALTEALTQERQFVVRGRCEVASKKARLTELQGGLIAITPKALAAPPKVIAKPTVENQKDITWLPMPRDVLEACVLVAPKDDVRYYLNGVFLQSEKHAVRTVATNGHSLLLHSTTAEAKEKLPAWLEAGVILPREGLSLALTTIGKLHDVDGPVGDLQIGYAKGHAHVTIKDAEEQVVFRMRVIDGQFPLYRKVIEEAATVLEGGERAPMSAITLDGNYVKQAVAIGTKLGSKGLTPFVGTEPKSPAVITFIGVPDALYIIMPIRASATDQLPSATMALMGRGLLGTLAALKATQTRQKKQMGEEKSEIVKKQMAGVIAERDQRIAAVMQALNGKALAAPKGEADGFDEPEKTPMKGAEKVDAALATVKLEAEAIERIKAEQNDSPGVTVN